METQENYWSSARTHVFSPPIPPVYIASMHATTVPAPCHHVPPIPRIYPLMPTRSSSHALPKCSHSSTIAAQHEPSAQNLPEDLHDRQIHHPAEQQRQKETQPSIHHTRKEQQKNQLPKAKQKQVPPRAAVQSRPTTSRYSRNTQTTLSRAASHLISSHLAYIYDLTACKVSCLTSRSRDLCIYFLLLLFLLFFFVSTASRHGYATRPSLLCCPSV